MFSFLSFPVLYLSAICPLTIFAKTHTHGLSIPKCVLTLYNFSNVFINLYIVLGMRPSFSNWNFGMTLPYTDALDYYAQWHLFTKYLDFFDTIFMILRHKWRQVNLLQIYHHGTIGMVWIYVLDTCPKHNASVVFGMFANSIIHTLMYLHYGMSGLGFRNPLKKMMTVMQMLQFCICIMAAFSWIHSYPSDWFYGALQICYMSSMLALFYDALYRKRKEVKESVNTALHIKINNVVYDATAFQKIHPGGNVINFYNRDKNKTIDATEAFNTFHLRSQRANKIIKTLPKIDTETDSHEMEDYREMIESWKEKGYFRQKYLVFLLWAGATLASTLLGYFTMYFGYPILGGVIVGFAWGQCGFVQHHSGHLGFTGNSSIDYLVQAFYEGILKGGSGRWWRGRHNKHHAMPNTIGYDGDLRTTPFFAWDEVLVKKVPTPLLKVQHLLFIPMLVLYVPVFFLTTKLFVLRKRYWDELGLIVIHFYLSSFFYSNAYDFCLFYSIGYGIQGLYLGLMFSLSHFAMPRIENLGTTWDSWQIKTTCNWGVGSRFAEFFSGFLNLQIEHHLVPQMPAENVHLIVTDVIEYCKTHNLPYNQYSFVEVLKKTVGCLRETAVLELKRRDKKKLN